MCTHRALEASEIFDGLDYYIPQILGVLYSGLINIILRYWDEGLSPSPPLIPTNLQGKVSVVIECCIKQHLNALPRGLSHFM